MAIDFRKSYPIVKWDLNTRNITKYYCGSVDDSANGYKLMIVQDGDILIPSTEEVYFYFEKYDKTHGYIKATIDENYFIIDLTNQVYAVAGDVSSNFQITDGTRWKTSPEFIIKVNNNNISDSIESSDDFKALQEAMNTISQSVIDATKAVADAKVAITDCEVATADAITATTATNTATSAANTATTATNTAISNAEVATADAITATTETNTAIANAKIATSNANTATANANTSATLANTKATLADTATTNANTIANTLEIETLRIFKDAVTNYSDLATTYPTPENGWTVYVSSDLSSYRYNGTSWINLGYIASVDIATNDTAGIVKASDDVNVSTDGIMSVPKIGDLTTLTTSIKTDTVSAINELNSDLSEKATTATYTTTITTTWTGSTAPYTQDITVTGILASDTPVVDAVLSDTLATAQAQEKAWNYVSRIKTSANTISVICNKTKPTTAIPIQIKAVR